MKVTEATILRINELCKERNITINKLCTISGITQSTVSDLVNGKSKNPSITTIKKLCDGLEIGIDEFFSGDSFKNLEQEIE